MNASAPVGPRIVLIAGTRPECLKLASLRAALRGGAVPIVVGSGQQPAMVARTLAILGLAPAATLESAANDAGLASRAPVLDYGAGSEPATARFVTLELVAHAR